MNIKYYNVFLPIILPPNYSSLKIISNSKKNLPIVVPLLCFSLVMKPTHMDPQKVLMGCNV